jgi:hypothetical protein
MIDKVFVDSNILIYAHDLDPATARDVRQSGCGNSGTPTPAEIHLCGAIAAWILSDYDVAFCAAPER